MSDIDELAEARAKLRDKGGAWRAQLLLSATKDPRPLLANALLALHEAPEWGGVLGYDEFALTAMALRPPPWVRPTGSGRRERGATAMTLSPRSGYSARA